jgi:hypothetical protein
MLNPCIHALTKDQAKDKNSHAEIEKLHLYSWGLKKVKYINIY